MSMPESIESLMSEIEQRLNDMEAQLPKRVDPVALSRSRLPFKALTCREALAWRMVELSRTAFDEFKRSRLASGMVLTRAAVETTAALWYLEDKIENVVETGTLGDIDDYLIRLFGGSRIDQDRPQAINVLTFVGVVEKTIPGYRRGYDILSEFSHPNWAGTQGLFTKLHRDQIMADYGRDAERNESPKHLGISNLSVAVGMFVLTYNNFGDLMPKFIAVAESSLTENK